MKAKMFPNPFRPGAGHMPPYLAGRQEEQEQFRKLLQQETIFQNLIVTGLRGVGKTVLLESFRPIALAEGWVWVGTDLSEAASVSEKAITTRLIADLAVFTSGVTITVPHKRVGLVGDKTERTYLSFDFLKKLYDSTPGLAADKLKAVLEYVAVGTVTGLKKKGIIFAYDESQNLSDSSTKEQYPLSLLLDVFASIQKKGIPFLLILTGLPTLFPKLVETRTYTERMFHIMFLKRLSETATKEAILKPVEDAHCSVCFDGKSVSTICKISGGYPYFIQFICKEVYDTWIQQVDAGHKPAVPVEELLRKLDINFFSGRWAGVTDRQRELLWAIAELPHHEEEFTVQDILTSASKLLKKSFSSSQINQMLSVLSHRGLVYKNRYGKYSFAVPMLGQFIKRNIRGGNRPSSP